MTSWIAQLENNHQDPLRILADRFILLGKSGKCKDREFSVFNLHQLTSTFEIGHLDLNWIHQSSTPLPSIDLASHAGDRPGQTNVNKAGPLRLHPDQFASQK